MPAEVPDYQILAAEHCPPGEQCPKVARRQPARIAIVGKLITDPATLAVLGVGDGEAAVEIDEELYREGHSGLDREAGEVA